MKKNMMGGIIVRYFPDCYQYEENELNEILSAALSTRECKAAIARVQEAAGMEERNKGSGYADDEKENGGYADDTEMQSGEYARLRNGTSVGGGMGIKTVKYASTRFGIVKRSKGQSAIDHASYISRSVIVSEYDGQTYRPKYHEDLVHCEVNLPENAPEEWKNRAALWNSVDGKGRSRNWKQTAGNWQKNPGNRPSSLPSWT